MAEEKLFNIDVKIREEIFRQTVALQSLYPNLWRCWVNKLVNDEFIPVCEVTRERVVFCSNFRSSLLFVIHQHKSYKKKLVNIAKFLDNAFPVSISLEDYWRHLGALVYAFNEYIGILHAMGLLAVRSFDPDDPSDVFSVEGEIAEIEEEKESEEEIEEEAKEEDDLPDG